MNRVSLVRALKEFCKSTGTKLSDYVVGAGGAMMLESRTLRSETDDVDVATSHRVWDLLYKLPHREEYFGDTEIRAFGKVDVHLVDNPVVIETLVSKEGVIYWDPETVLRFKQYLNRDKDQKDITALKKYIASNK